MLGIIFSLLSAACFALNAAAARRAVLSGTVLMGLSITVPLGVPLFYLLAWATGEAGRLWTFSPDAILWFSAAGIVHFVLGRYCNYAAAAAIGTNLSAPLMQCEVLVTLALAMVVLGEHLTPLRVLGIALVMIGPSLVLNREDAKARSKAAAAERPASTTTPVFQPRYLEGYSMAFLAAVFYGLSPIFIGLGLKAAGGSGVLAGGVVSYVAASLLVLLVLPFVGKRHRQFNAARGALGWFIFAGVIVFFSHAFRYAAMAVAPVSIVTALQRLSSIFRIYFGWLINRDHEVFDNSVIAATVVSMLGAIVLSISTETFLALADWPQWIVDAARWRWP